MRSLALWCCLACLAAGEVSVELSATPAQVNVGDAVTVSITYRWPRTWTADEPDPGPAFADAFVTSLPPPERASAGDEQRHTFRLTVLAGRSGAWELPRPEFTANGPAGTQTARAPQVLVQVGTEAAPPKLPAARPLPVRPPAPPLVRQVWPWAVAGGLLLVAIGLGIWLLRRRRTPPETPAQRFRREIAAAHALGDGRTAAAALSLALRRYAGAVWDFDGAGATARETAALVRVRAPAGEAGDLAAILGKLDDLRWAAGDLATATVAPLIADGEAWQRTVEARLTAEAASAQHPAPSTQLPVPSSQHPAPSTQRPGPRS